MHYSIVIKALWAKLNTHNFLQQNLKKLKPLLNIIFCRGLIFDYLFNRYLFARKDA